MNTCSSSYEIYSALGKNSTKQFTQKILRLRCLRFSLRMEWKTAELEMELVTAKALPEINNPSKNDRTTRR